MTQKSINLGTADQGNGDPIRVAFGKVNDNFTELYTALGLIDNSLNLGAFEFTGSVMTTTDSSAIVIDQATTITSNLSVGGDVLPSVALGGDLGSSTLPWRSLYVSNNTIYIGGTAVGLDANGNLTTGGTVVGSTPAWANITGKPSFATVATTGAYADLTGKPTIPTLVSQLSNDSGFLTSVGNISNIQSEGNINIEVNLTDSTKRIWQFGEDGNLTLPAGGNISEGGGLSGAIRLTPAGGANANQALLIYPTGFAEGDHIHLTAGGGSTELYLGDDDHYVKLASNGFVVIKADDGVNGAVWGFSPDGTTSIPGDIKSDGNINIDINLSDSTLRRWQFGEDGDTVFPNNVSINYSGNNIQFPRIIADSGKAFSVQAQGTSGSAALSWTVNPDAAGQYAAVSVSRAGGDNLAKVVIQAQSDSGDVGTAKTWKFNETGILSLPNGSVIKDTDYVAVAFGLGAGTISQGFFAVAVGAGAGYNGQGNAAVAIGSDAGVTSQGISAVAVGNLAGENNQGNTAVAIGEQAGRYNQGANAVAIGREAGYTGQAANSIILNATGATLNQTTANTFTVKPVRQDETADAMYYNSSTGEITYADAFSFSVAADDSTQRLISSGELIKFIGAGGITTASDAEGYITINYVQGDIRSEGNINIDINLADSTLRRWQFGEDGALTLPSGGNISEGGGFTGAIRLTPAGGANANQALLIYPTAGDGDHIHLTAGGGTTELYLGDDNHYVRLGKGAGYNGTIVIAATGFPNTVAGIVSSGNWAVVSLSNLATTGGTGTGLTVTVTQVAGVATAIAIVSGPMEGYTANDTITVTSGAATATFYISVLAPQWVFAPEGDLYIPTGKTIRDTGNGDDIRRIPGPYADDAAAAAASVAVGNPYHKTGTSGQVFVRLT